MKRERPVVMKVDPAFRRMIKVKASQRDTSIQKLTKELAIKQLRKDDGGFDLDFKF